jgi:hypothetical protein
MDPIPYERTTVVSEDNANDARKPYVKTGLIVGAGLLPMLGWAAKQVLTGAKNAVNGQDNFVSYDED